MDDAGGCLRARDEETEVMERLECVDETDEHRESGEDSREEGGVGRR